MNLSLLKNAFLIGSELLFINGNTLHASQLHFFLTPKTCDYFRLMDQKAWCDPCHGRMFVEGKGRVYTRIREREGEVGGQTLKVSSCSVVFGFSYFLLKA